jgi:penicillin G amidase
MTFLPKDPDARPTKLSPSPQDSAQDPELVHRHTDKLSPSTRDRGRIFKRLAITASILVLLLIITTVTTAIILRLALHASLPQLDGNLPVAGLSAPVTITRDGQGVPSIHASNLDDLIFAQGYITASDRLFQMDALRRHGAGELAELLGPSLIEHDREQRILQLRSAADRAVAVLAPDQLHQLQAYANGVNAFINTHSKTTAHHNTLPVEFHILRYTPAPWTPRDSLLIALVMSQDLSTEFPTKLNREALAAHLPASLLPDLYPTGSWRDHPPTQTPTDLTAPTTPIEQVPLDNTQSSVEPHDLLAVDAILHANLCNDCIPGSNNWAVSGVHTATGAPLLSNDMHLSLSAPDIWYEASLHVDPTSSAPAQLDVTGFTLPGVPFVIVGRNSFVAWAFTNSGADVQDVLIEHLRQSNNGSTEYEHSDHSWSPVGHQLEHIRVRAGRDITLDVLTTTHTIGVTTITTPIISPLYKTEHRALALAWTIYDPSTITSPMYSINTATDAASLVAAFSGFGSVSQNLVYADAHHIGYHLLGRIPIRGPAIQHPRPVQPFILPDRTPSDDDTDESGDDPTASIPHPHITLASLTFSEQPTPLPVSRRHPDPEHREGEGPPHFALASFTSTLSSRPDPERSEGEVERSAAPTKLPPSAQDLASTHYNSVILSAAQRSRRTPRVPIAPTPSAPSTTKLPPSAQDLSPSAQNPTTAYTTGTPISTIPIDVLDVTQTWSGYIPYDALPSVLDPTSGILATANARIVTDAYPYFIANDWADPYRVERINHLLSSDIAANNKLTPDDMLHIQTDVHSEFDLLIAQRLAYALDHSALTKKDLRLQQAANLLRGWTGDLSPDSAPAAIVSSARNTLWPMLLAPHLRDEQQAQQSAEDATQKATANPRTTKHRRLSPQELDDLLDLYTWGERDSALEQLLLHTPTRWLPHAYSNWDDFLTTAVQRGLKLDNAPANLSTWTYGSTHPVDIAHPIFGSHSPISTLLGVATGSGFHPNGGDGTTIKATGLHFGPSERFTADLANPDNTHANITTGESGNPASPWFLDQFLPWLYGTTLPLPLDHPTTTHTLTLTPQ